MLSHCRVGMSLSSDLCRICYSFIQDIGCCFPHTHCSKQSNHHHYSQYEIIVIQGVEYYHFLYTTNALSLKGDYMCSRILLGYLHQCDELIFVEEYVKRCIISEDTINCLQHFAIQIHEVIYRI